jgi:hypothetical protein
MAVMTARPDQPRVAVVTTPVTGITMGRISAVVVIVVVIMPVVTMPDGVIGDVVQDLIDGER